MDQDWWQKQESLGTFDMVKKAAAAWMVQYCSKGNCQDSKIVSERSVQMLNERSVPGKSSQDVHFSRM